MLLREMIPFWSLPRDLNPPGTYFQRCLVHASEHLESQDPAALPPEGTVCSIGIIFVAMIVKNACRPGAATAATGIDAKADTDLVLFLWLAEPQ